jgi:hypothetical protein
VRFAVYSHSRFFARGLNQTKDFAGAYIEPVFLVLHAIRDSIVSDQGLSIGVLAAG